MGMSYRHEANKLKLSDFEEGKTYIVTEKPFDPPDGSQTVLGRVRTVKILSPASASNRMVFDGEKYETPSNTEVENWKKFLCVLNTESKNIHLLDPDTLAFASIV